MTRLNFKLEATTQSSRARAGSFTTLHNRVETPIFMPVGTQATVKGVMGEDLEALGAQILLANTYHLLLRPGTAVFERLGGIQKFMNWPRSVLTDSGGFQIFSLPNARRMTEEGAHFVSYVDGQKILLSPERSIAMQRAIASDIMMVLDQCVPGTSDYGVAKSAMELTHRWAMRSLMAREGSPAALFAIMQGAGHGGLRRESAAFLADQPFDGFAIGGLAVGETRAEREDLTELSASLLPAALPRYLMGVGTPIDLLEAVHRGVDMFDCILPTAMAQHGWAYTSQGQLRLERRVYKFSELALDPDCGCKTCLKYSRAYLHHLIKTAEPVGWQLLAYHNLNFYMELMREIRQYIVADNFYRYYLQKREQLVQTDALNPVTPPKIKRRKRLLEQLGNYRVKASLAGHYSIQHIESGELMHSVNNPDEEAEHLYVKQSGLVEKLSDEKAEPLVLWDVGLGAAHNTMAAVNAYEKFALLSTRGVRPMEIISFENDLNSLALALKNVVRFAHLRHGAPNAIFRAGFWRSAVGGVSWRLIKGDFKANMATAPRPDVIFYDPFSYKTNSRLWSLAIFRDLMAQLENVSTELFTYTASTQIRSALLGAGFYVADGIGIGPKAVTTIALSRKSAAQSARRLLDRTWLARWESSHTKFPVDLVEAEYEAFSKLIFAHPQFGSSRHHSF